MSAPRPPDLSPPSTAGAAARTPGPATGRPPPHRALRRAQRGVTLLELTLVAMMLAIIAAMAVPSLRATATYDLDLAAREVADALAYARALAQRSGAEHGVTVELAADRVVVWRADLASSPVGQASVVYHPTDRQPWDRRFGNLGLPDVDVTGATAPFEFTGDGRRETVLFDASGAPLWIVNPSGTRHQLATGSVQLTRHGHTRTVTLAPATGRVTVQ